MGISNLALIHLKAKHLLGSLVTNYEYNYQTLDVSPSISTVSGS